MIYFAICFLFIAFIYKYVIVFIKFNRSKKNIENYPELKTCCDIDEFFQKEDKVIQYFKNGLLLQRKAQLSNILNLNTCKTEIVESLITTILGAVIGAVIGIVFALDDFVDDLNNLGLSQTEAFALICLTAFVIVFIFYGLIKNKLNIIADEKTETSRYELEYIDKFIERHIEVNLPNAKILEYKKAEDLFYCRRFNAYIVKPQS